MSIRQGYASSPAKNQPNKAPPDKRRYVPLSSIQPLYVVELKALAAEFINETLGTRPFRQR
jgi:hypothetical protein